MKHLTLSILGGVLALATVVLCDTFYLRAEPRLFGWGGSKEKEVQVSKGWGWGPSIKGLGIYGGIRVHHKDPGGGWGGWGGGWGVRVQQGWGSIKGEEKDHGWKKPSGWGWKHGGGGGGGEGGGGHGGWGWKKPSGWGWGHGGGGGHGHGGHGDDDDYDDYDDYRSLVLVPQQGSEERSFVSSIEDDGDSFEDDESSEVSAEEDRRVAAFNAPIIYDPVFY